MLMNAGQIAGRLERLSTGDPAYATEFVELLLAGARQAAVSDLHLQPEGRLLDVRWRKDGVLQPVGRFSRGEASDIISRLKVLADLLTYRTDVPQEGRIRDQANGVEMRVSTFPTLYGERAVVRLFAADRTFERLGDLGYPEQVEQSLRFMLAETSGLLLITGPAGSGKTTTCYAMLRELSAKDGGRSIVSLEDPIESAIPGVAQCQVHAASGFDLATGLRSLMRQDPEVLMVGEIRDRETAQTAFQASLTGHLVLSTFHAGSAAEAVSRLVDMGVEPYLLRSGILAILGQRLVRRLCDCATPIDPGARPDELLGLAVAGARAAAGCNLCHHTGYRGRMLICEMLVARGKPIGKEILERSDAQELERAAIAQGMVTRWERALAAVEAGLTSPMEIRRVLGFL